MTFVDANPFASAGDYSVTNLDWGTTLAGTLPTVSIVTDPSYVGPGSGWKVVADTVTYAEKGLFTVSPTIHDDDGSNASTRQTQFNVADAALTDSTPATTVDATEGLATTNVVVMTFTDANPFAAAGDFSISSLNWGGTLAGTLPTMSIVADPAYVGSGSGWKVVADTVTYAGQGTFTVSLTVHDAGGSDVSTSQTTFDTLQVTSPFPFSGEYGVTGGSPALATISQLGSALTLNGATAATVIDAAHILVNGTDTATYGNSTIVFTTGTFAGQTWTKLDLPPDFTNQQGPRPT